MGSVRITETSQVGEAYSSVEYEFSDSVDFLAWESDRAERMTNAVKSFTSAMYGEPDEPMDTPSRADVQVKKKDTKH